MRQAPEFVVNIIKSIWYPGLKILEIGCGPAYLRKTFGKDYIGTDITDEPYSPGMPRDVDLTCPADKLLLEDKSVNIVIIKSAFFLFQNHGVSLKEAHRVLKPGGKLIIFDYNWKTQQTLQKREGHRNYPCWTQWGLKKLIQNNGFIHASLLLAQTEQPAGIKRLYQLIMQELRGTWAIVCATKK